MEGAIGLALALVLVGGIAAAVSLTSMGEGVGASVIELQKLGPGYWNRTTHEQRTQVHVPGAGGEILPAWSPNSLPDLPRRARPPRSAAERQQRPKPASTVDGARIQEEVRQKAAAGDPDAWSDFWGAAASPHGHVVVGARGPG